MWSSDALYGWKFGTLVDKLGVRVKWVGEDNDLGRIYLGRT